MGGLRSFQQSMEKHFVAVEEELCGLKSQTQLLLENDRLLTEELNHHIKNERSLKSAFRDVKAELAEAQHILIRVKLLLKKLSHENVALKEKLRRERELLTEAKQAAAESATQHQRVTMGFMTKLRSLQKRSETLYDDQCASEWRKLQQALKSWTGRTFKDESAMSKMTLESAIFATVFDYSFAFSPNTQSEQLLTAVGKIVRDSGSSHTWEIWRLATSKALDNRASFENHRLDDPCNQFSQMVEALFSDYYSPNIHKDNTHRALLQIFEDCLSFKKKLERQEFEYQTRQSPPGTVYSTEKMKSLNFVEDDGSIVTMSIWPSLYKLSFENEELLIQPEAVWTKEPVHVGDDSPMKNNSDVHKEIKREVKTEGDDDELSLVMLSS
ncbi:hypothetical protein EYB26_004843 [Talaromyces marneffei]|uniref:uncharacterized protein n=1 Tax=Talaromyces marneffei TaxID=37727 RepID=UPI0012A883DB|nr:uncharacterized protein EYB26_004843 [Talaromyces marneffei]QGA17173.1 hypothetical protein EYB26_004843 [Talaromyces marneffei]